MGAAMKLSNSIESVQNTDLVHGPTPVAPFGQVLEVNPLGAEKICAFDCVYCNLGPSRIRLNQLKNGEAFPTLQAISESFENALKQIHNHGPSFDRILISGNGEPALHPEFAGLVKSILDIRGVWAPAKPVIVMTGGAGLEQRKISDAMNLVDERVVKIDAGNEKLFKVVNAPLSRTNLAKVLTGVRKLRDVTVQSLFFEGNMTNTSQSDIDDWIEVIAIIRPKAVMLQGLTHPIEGLARCEQDTLYTIASRLERRTQIKSTVFP